MYPRPTGESRFSDLVGSTKSHRLTNSGGSVGRRQSPLRSTHWLGFVINPSGPFVQMPKDKHVAVLALLKELAEGKVFSLKAIEKALGKIPWATATCPMAKPFLQPFWAWKSAVKTVPSSSAFPTFLQTVPSDVTLFTMVFMDRC